MKLVITRRQQQNGDEELGQKLPIRNTKQVHKAVKYGETKASLENVSKTLTGNFKS